MGIVLTMVHTNALVIAGLSQDKAKMKMWRKEKRIKQKRWQKGPSNSQTRPTTAPPLSRCNPQ